MQITTAEMPTFFDLSLFPQNPDKWTIPCVQGAPGVGKTEGTNQYFEAAKAQGKFERIVHLRLGQKDFLDIAGLPVMVDGKLHYGPPAWIPFADENPPRTLIFGDEFADAERMTYNAFNELLDGSLGGRPLCPHTRIITASNRAADRAGARNLPSQVRSRLCFADVEPDIESWTLNFAIPKNVREEVISFLNFRPELLHKFDPAERVNPDPRAWTKLSHMLPRAINSGSDFRMVHVLADGKVGEGAATEFLAHMRMFSKIPDMATIFADPLGAPVPGDDDLSVLYAIAIGLAVRVTPKQAGAFFTYLDRLNRKDIAVVAVKAVEARDSTILGTPAGVKWCSQNVGLF